MADNVAITAGSGTSIATEDVSNVQHQKVKVEFGADGVATMVSSSDPLPVTAATLPLPSGAATSAKQDTIISHVDGIEALLAGTLTVTGGGGGTEYTEDAASAANPVGNALIVVREDARAGGLTTTDGDNVALRGNNKGELYVKTTDSDALLTTIDGDTGNISTKIDTLAGSVSGTEMQVDVLTMPTVTVNSHAVTNAGTFAVQVDGNALTSLQLIDDPIATLGTTTYTETSTKGNIIGAVRRDADTTLVDTTNEIGPLQMDANGRLKVEAFSGEALPVTFTGSTDVATQTTLALIKAKTDNIPAQGQALDAASLPVVLTAAQITTLTPPAAITGFATETTLGSVKTSVELIDNAVSGTGFNISQIGGAAAPIGAGLEATAVRVTLPTDGTGKVGLNAGTNAIGKLAANSGVDIGDVDILSIAAGDNNIGNVDIVTVPTDPFGANADAASATGSISAKLKGIATALGVTALDLGSGTGGTRTLRTFQDTAQFVGGTGTDTSAVQRVSLATNVALPAGTNGIGKLTANSGVTIGAIEIAAAQTLGTVTTVSTVTNQSQEGGVAISLNAGAVDTGTRRIVQANGAGKTILSAGGSASSAGNNTLVAAGTNKLKVFAFSLSTQSTTAVTCIFQSGAGGTELWRVVLQAGTSVSTGANLAVSPPAWLFATGSATLLNLNLSSANAVHWSVSYFDEA